jgi:hypothetical protein
VREKNQYRLFFTDKYALYATFFGNDLMGMMPILLDHKVQCIASQEDESGNEVVMFGSDNGMVYQMEKGTSFDGANIECFLYLHFHHMGNPDLIKKWRGASIEATGDGYHELQISHDVAYSSTLKKQATSKNVVVNFSNIRWDSGNSWDTLIWDGSTMAPNRIKLSNSGENISLIMRSNADYYEPIKITGANIRYNNRRPKR